MDETKFEPDTSHGWCDYCDDGKVPVQYLACCGVNVCKDCWEDHRNKFNDEGDKK